VASGGEIACPVDRPPEARVLATPCASPLPLTAADIGQIEDAEKLIAFVGGLDYDVADSPRLDHAALGLDSEDLRQQIRSVRRVGVDPVDGEVVVYLFELRSVTIALTQVIARRFRGRPESALLVLTKDFEALDFVLVDREIVPGTAWAGAPRPRTLTVPRRNPSAVDLRVLKRFTFTEADGAY